MGRRSRSPASPLLSLLLLVSAGACTSVYGQPRPSKPHGVVNIAVAHHERDAQKPTYDVILLDGMRIDISERKTPLTLRLSPGKHSLEMASVPLQYENQVQLMQETNPMPTCGVVGLSPDPTCMFQVPIYQERMSLVPSLRGGCVRDVPLDIRAGQNIDVTLRVDERGRCL